MPEIALMIAEGSEEMETVIIADTLRRANLELEIVSLAGNQVVCSRKVGLLADRTFSNVEMAEYDVIILPGGMGGTQAFMACDDLLEGIKAHSEKGKLLCAICAAPLALQAAGLISGLSVTCHPSVSDMITNARYTGERVQRDGNILTSQGPGTAFEFALELIKVLKGPDIAQSVGDGLVL